LCKKQIFFFPDVVYATVVSGVFTNILEQPAASICKVEVKMQVAGSSEIMVTTYKTMCCHNSEEFLLVYTLPYRT
jgi:hypothetical protein